MVKGNTPIEQMSVSEQIDWLTASIKISNGLDETFTSTGQITHLMAYLVQELNYRFPVPLKDGMGWDKIEAD
jgi:hypothetical protein